jgi:hypothetical protein
MKDRNTGSGDLNLHPQLHTFFISGRSVFLKKLQAAKSEGEKYGQMSRSSNTYMRQC